MLFCLYAHVGAPNITELTFDRQSRTLTCTFSSGPDFNVTWTKDGAVISLNGTFQQMQMIADATKGIYQNILTIAQSLAEHNVYGLYSCMVENLMGSSNRTIRYSGKIFSYLRVGRLALYVGIAWTCNFYIESLPTAISQPHSQAPAHLAVACKTGNDANYII